MDPLPGLHYLLASQKGTILAVRGAIGLGRPWYAHFMQDEERDWGESSEMFRGSRGYPRDGPLHGMHGERTPWPGVGVLDCTVESVLWYLDRGRHSTGAVCSARTCCYCKLVLGLSLEEVSDAQAVIRCFRRRSGCLGSIGTSAANGVLSVDGGSEGKVRGGKGTEKRTGRK